MKKIVIAIVFVLMLGALGHLTYQWVKEEMPNFKYVDKQTIYQGTLESHIPIILEDEVIKDKATILKDRLYIELALVQEKLDSYYYWDEGEGVLTYTTLEDLVRVHLDKTVAYVNQSPIEKDYTILIETEQGPYLDLEFLREWSDITSVYYLEPMRWVVEKNTLDHEVGEVVAERAYIRESASDKSQIITKVLQGEKVTIYSEEEGFYYVRSESGWLGYIPISKIGHRTFYRGSSTPTNYLDKSYLPQEKIVMAWHQVTNVQANQGLEEHMNGTSGINVLSPTWFTIADETGRIKSIGTTEYVNWANTQGVQVWPLVDNQFSSALTHAVLQSTEKRERMIESLIAQTLSLGAEGINVDFENVATEDGQAFVQFIRELAVRCYEEELTLSVDTYVPRPWTAHYNRTELGKVVDYVMIMAYDEHWSTSPESGSVASIGFVEEGIVDTLKEVPNEKVVLGLPFYTRLWKEETIDGEIKVSSSAYSMSYASDLLDEKMADRLWNDKTQQYYGEYMEEGIRYRIWLEEERSIEEKLKLYKTYELVGVAGWKLGLEKDQVWPVIEAYVE